MTKYIYNGPNCMLGRFGPVNKGDVLLLTDQEVQTVLKNPNFVPVDKPVEKPTDKQESPPQKK